MHADKLFQRFEAGGQRVFIIVNVRKAGAFPDRPNLESAGERENLRRWVRRGQERIIGRLDSNQVRVIRRFEFLSAIAAEVTLRGLEEILGMEEVLSVEEDGVLKLHTKQGIPLMNATQPRTEFGGNGVSIAVCDTGIDYTHPKLGGGAFPNGKVIGGYDFGDEDGNPMDANGHGTNCAGIAAGNIGSTGDYIGGVAPEAKLYALKVTQGTGGEAYNSDLIAAWEWSIDHKNDSPATPILIISTSLGTGGFTSACDNYSPSMTQAASNVTAAGITLFASSGNSGYCDKIAFPGCISHIISVGAVFDASLGTLGFCVEPESCAPNKESHPSCTPTKRLVAWSYSIPPNRETPYSNTANFLGLFAPSHNAYTTARGGGYTSNFGGTSAACPYAAGAAAVLQSAAKTLNGGFLAPGSVRSILAGTGDLITDVKISHQKRRINLGNAVAALTSSVPAAGPSILIMGLPILAGVLILRRKSR
ncbi:MAG: S8 family serine peptidase [Syntrophaceae bacterium]|nr:S8 family serine peptidase [Syntrophaceae bacterium]